MHVTGCALLYVVCSFCIPYINGDWNVVTGWPQIPSQYVPLGGVASVDAYQDEVYITQRYSIFPLMVSNCIIQRKQRSSSYCIFCK